MSGRQSLPADHCPWARDLASGLHDGGQCRGLYPVLPRVPARGAPAGADLARPWDPDRWLRQHDQEHAHTVSRSAPRLLSPPRPQQAPRHTHGDRVAGAQGTPLAVPHPLVPGASAQELAGVCAWPTRSEEHTSELQSPCNLVCRLLLEKKKKKHLVVCGLTTAQHILAEGRD